MTKRYFGTDGIRGRVGEPPITPDFVLKLGWACGRVFTEQWQGKATVLIGKDTRVSGYMFESALEGRSSCRRCVDVKLLGPMPTPAVRPDDPQSERRGGHCNQRLPQSVLR